MAPQRCLNTSGNLLGQLQLPRRQMEPSFSFSWKLWTEEKAGQWVTSVKHVVSLTVLMMILKSRKGKKITSSHKSNRIIIKMLIRVNSLIIYCTFTVNLKSVPIHHDLNWLHYLLFILSLKCCIWSEPWPQNQLFHELHEIKTGFS